MAFCIFPDEDVLTNLVNAALAASRRCQDNKTNIIIRPQDMKHLGTLYYHCCEVKRRYPGAVERLDRERLRFPTQRIPLTKTKLREMRIEVKARCV